MVTAKNIFLLLRSLLVTAQVLQLILGFFYRLSNYSYCSNNNIPFESKKSRLIVRLCLKYTLLAILCTVESLKVFKSSYLHKKNVTWKGEGGGGIKNVSRIIWMAPNLKIRTFWDLTYYDQKVLISSDKVFILVDTLIDFVIFELNKNIIRS